METPEQGDDTETPETGAGSPSEGGETPSEDGDFSDDNEGDEGVRDEGNATDYKFEVIADIRTSSTSFTSTTSSTTSPAKIFKFLWRDGTNNSSFGVERDFGSGTRTMNSGYTESGAYMYASYFYYNFYQWIGVHPRYATISSNDSSYVLCGINLSSSWTNTSFTTNVGSVYFYEVSGSDGSPTYGTTAPTASTGVGSWIIGANTATISFHLKFRKIYTFSYTHPSSTSSATAYAGVAKTLPTIASKTGHMAKWYCTVLEERFLLLMCRRI